MASVSFEHKLIKCCAVVSYRIICKHERFTAAARGYYLLVISGGHHQPAWSRQLRKVATKSLSLTTRVTTSHGRSSGYIHLFQCMKLPLAVDVTPRNGHSPSQIQNRQQKSYGVNHPNPVVNVQRGLFFWEDSVKPWFHVKIKLFLNMEQFAELGCVC